MLEWMKSTEQEIKGRWRQVSCKTPNKNSNSAFQAEVSRMDMIQRDNKMEFGYYMITDDKNGLYAYAKVRSNGI